MARNEQDREDLLRDATALVERAEISCDGFAENIVAGFRRDGSLSMYFGADPVYQFNSRGELRRAYIGGLLIKAERGRLVSLDRQRTARDVALVRSDLSDHDQELCLANANSRLGGLLAAISRGAYKIVGQVPQGCHVLERVSAWLTEHVGSMAIAKSPREC
jgi:hypothetical protein